MRKTKKRKTGEKGPPYASKWPYFSTMLFLADSVKAQSVGMQEMYMYVVYM